MTDRRQENARTLASLLGIDEDHASSLLDISISLTVTPDDRPAARTADFVETLLQRTAAFVTRSVSSATALEIVFGAATPKTESFVRVLVTPEIITVGIALEGSPLSPQHPLVLLVTSCYVCAVALHFYLGERLRIDGRSPAETLKVPIRSFIGNDQSWLAKTLTLEDTYLAGAGAVGNGFLYALSLLDVAGELAIVDFDTVSDGNLNRCVWFENEDRERPKADVLAERASTSLPQLALRPIRSTLQQAKNVDNPRWLKRLIVATDSPRTRRSLQTEIPGEVFDASTTGVKEIVIHHHRQPTEHACLACIYYETADELSRERHIAESLGVTLEDVQRHTVEAAVAIEILKRYPRLDGLSLVGMAYDSLFKALCAEAALATPGQHQVFAPFAFVSVLAGAFLAIEMGRRLTSDTSIADYNYWRISPWTAPVEALKAVRPRHPQCEFCGQPILVNVASDLWAGT